MQKETGCIVPSRDALVWKCKNGTGGIVPLRNALVWIHVLMQSTLTWFGSMNPLLSYVITIFGLARQGSSHTRYCWTNEAMIQSWYPLQPR
jgi:hypothetical protein